MENKVDRHSQIISKIHECIQKEDNFIITTHMNPDGDSIASVLVFASLLKHCGKNFIILLNDPVPKKFDFLEGVDDIRCYRDEILPFQPSVFIVLDASDLDRIGSVNTIFSDHSRIINIDHHPSNCNFGYINLIDPKESSTVEIVYRMVTQLKISVSPSIATMVYTGIMCDTGRFLFPNTNSRSLSVCSNMIRLGANSERIAERIYFRTSQKTIRALAQALSTIEFHFNGTVACIHLSNGFLDPDEKIDTEGFVDNLLAVEGTEVEFFMVEIEPKFFRVSLRSKHFIDVNAVAKAFGGGGHKRASGCCISGTVDEVKNRIFEIIETHLK
jgi:phosphoesterase RecJ-like protein